MSHRAKAFAAALCLVALSHPALADTFVIGVENTDYAPNGAVVGGEYKGYGRAVLDAYAKDRGHVFQYRPLPVSRLFRELVEGVVDFKYPDNKFWQQDIKAGKPVVYSDAVANYIDGVMVQPQNKGKGLAALHTLGTLQGFTAWEYLDAIKAGQIKLAENPGFQGLLYQAEHDRVDGAYVGVAEATYQLEQVLKTPGALVFDPSLPHTSSFYSVSTIKHPDVIADFNAWLKDKAELVTKLKADYAIEAGVK
jgi:hypothetical protein